MHHTMSSHRARVAPAIRSILPLALAVMVACDKSQGTPNNASNTGAAPQGGAPAMQPSAQPDPRLKAVDDSIAMLLAQVETSTTDLRVRVEQRERNLEQLATSNPGALARLGAVVADYTKLKATLKAKDDTIAQLRARVRALVAENSRLRAEVARLRGTVASRDTLLKKGDSVRTATEARLATTEAARDSVRDKLYTGYVLVAEMKELERLGLVGKTNRLGLGREVLTKVDPSLLRKVNTTDTESIDVPASAGKVKVLTTHGEGSYVIAPNGRDSQLRIQNKDAFWATSRVLVVAF